MNIGLIGLGYWGKHYVRIINNSNRCKLVALCDLNEEVFEKYNYLNISTFTNYLDMFKSGKINSVIIVTIANTHEQIIKNALKYNIKILVEKPYVLSINECNNIEPLLNKDSKLMVGHTYLFNEKINYIKKILNTEFRNTKSINFTWTCYGPIRKDTNPIFDLAVHPISILFWLFPDKNITNISCIRSFSNHTYFVIFKIDEIIISLNISWSSPGKTRQMIINNDNKKIIFDDVTNIEAVKILYLNNPNFDEENIGQHLIHSDGNIIIPQIENKEPLTEQFNHWLDYIEDKTQCYSNHFFSSKIIKLCEDIEKITK